MSLRQTANTTDDFNITKEVFYVKSSSFLGGILVGVFAAMWASRRKQSLMSVMNGAGSALKFASMTSNRHESSNEDLSAALKTEGPASENATKAKGANNAQVYPSSGTISAAGSNHSKEYSLKQLTDFIKGDADVRREVEAILKETHTPVPGL
ncbi:hypothetical protein IM700_007655 [Paenibacillus sp. DXFW5]|uniref:YtxH domain-containing protein n=1 Tax=Paenibacillus rhizolycopersici TaxID=2780073 RepID=A0ABS2H404_9BACL|nr:hypothetical protein [Paenibacillus rhizolycopersici]MBM6995536.1 hypothetical protein [Paenibacillus rhizolycopersici]